MRVMDELAAQLVGPDRISDLCEAGGLPDYFKTIPERLAAIQPSTPVEQGDANEAGLVLAGGTDLYVQRGEEIPELPVRLLNLGEGAVGPARLESGKIVVDARMTFEAFAMDPLVCEMIPQIEAYNELIASWPVRTRATLAGNLCNASPIADMTCLLMALGSELRLTANGRTKVVALKDFYLGYKQLNKSADEWVSEISFPAVAANEFVAWEKVSKRAWLDIATVNASGRVAVTDGVIESASLALGGVAATPLYLAGASAFLSGRSLNPESILGMLDVALAEFEPISDVRGSATYKKLLARQLLLALFATEFSDQLDMEAIYASL